MSEILPVGMAEIAARAGVQPDTVKKWTTRHADFPRPRWLVGGDCAWDWVEVHAWIDATNRAEGIEAGWKRNFRLRASGDTKVILESVDDEQGWVHIATFVPDMDGDYTPFPGRWLRETVAPAKADLIAWQHLQKWQSMVARWGRLHPGDPLPDHLIPQPRI